MVKAHHVGNHKRQYRSRHERGYGSAWVKIRKAALIRDQYLCQHCLPRPTPATDVDHIKPKADGGTDELSNLQSLCFDCHKIKTAKENSTKQQIGDDGWPIA